MFKEFCDICEKELGSSYDDYSEYKVKVKEQWHSWYEHGWRKLTICNECKAKIFDLYQTYMKGKE